MLGWYYKMLFYMLKVAHKLTGCLMVSDHCSLWFLAQVFVGTCFFKAMEEMSNIMAYIGHFFHGRFNRMLSLRMAWVFVFFQILAIIQKSVSNWLTISSPVLCVVLSMEASSAPGQVRQEGGGGHTEGSGGTSIR